MLTAAVASAPSATRRLGPFLALFLVTTALAQDPRNRAYERLEILKGGLGLPHDHATFEALGAWGRAREAELLDGRLPAAGVLVYQAHAGLGNEILSLASAMVLAYGTDRLLLVNTTLTQECKIGLCQMVRGPIASTITSPASGVEWSELWNHYENLVKSPQHQQHQQNQQLQQHQQHQQHLERRELSNGHNGTSTASEMTYYQILPSTSAASAGDGAGTLFLNLDHTECSNLEKLCSFNPVVEWAGHRAVNVRSNQYFAKFLLRNPYLRALSWSTPWSAAPSSSDHNHGNLGGNSGVRSGGISGTLLRYLLRRVRPVVFENAERHLNQVPPGHSATDGSSVFFGLQIRMLRHKPSVKVPATNKHKISFIKSF